MTDLHLVYDCPPWCTTDHSIDVPAVDQVHEGKLTEARMPDGRLILDVQMVREPDALLPELVVSGAFDSLSIDVSCLDAAGAENLHMQLMRIAEAVRLTLRPSRAGGPSPASSGGVRTRARTSGSGGGRRACTSPSATAGSASTAGSRSTA